MTQDIIPIIIIALAVGAAAGVCVHWIFSRERDPQTDEEHASTVHRRAQALNIAMHNARSVGLNPAIKIAPIDPDLQPGTRPLIATVERDRITVTNRKIKDPRFAIVGREQ